MKSPVTPDTEGTEGTTNDEDASAPLHTIQNFVSADRIGGTVPGPSLFIGPNESQTDEKWLRDQGIGRVLTCHTQEEELLAIFPRFEHVKYLRLDFSTGDRVQQGKRLDAALGFLLPPHPSSSSHKYDDDKDDDDNGDNADPRANDRPHVLVTCRDGCSISGTVAVAYLMQCRGSDLSAAIALARLSRPGIAPPPHLLGHLRRLEAQVPPHLPSVEGGGRGGISGRGDAAPPLLPNHLLSPLVGSLANDRFTDSESGSDEDSDNDGGGNGATSNATSSAVSKGIRSEADEEENEEVDCDDTDGDAPGGEGEAHGQALIGKGSFDGDVSFENVALFAASADGSSKVGLNPALTQADGQQGGPAGGGGRRRRGGGGGGGGGQGEGREGGERGEGEGDPSASIDFDIMALRVEPPLDELVSSCHVSRVVEPRGEESPSHTTRDGAVAKEQGKGEDQDHESDRGGSREDTEWVVVSSKNEYFREETDEGAFIGSLG